MHRVLFSCRSEVNYETITVNFEPLRLTLKLDIKVNFEPLYIGVDYETFCIGISTSKVNFETLKVTYVTYQ
jgi:hypothetical protein